jgi:medium-chain acyl-[acyl-carrier-protein] hydrolase
MNYEKPGHWYETHKVSLYEVDFLNKLRVDFFFNYLQDAASNHAETLGWGFSDLIKENLTWILSRVKLEIIKYPGIGESINIETWPKGLDGLLALRDFRITDSSGNLFALAASAWLLINVKTKHPVKTDELHNRINNITLDSDYAIKDTPGKIVPSGNFSECCKRIIKYTDIDLNHHVNNAKYIEFALDCLSMEEYKRKKLKSIQVNFLNELKYGDSVSLSKVQPHSNQNYIYIQGIKNEGIKVFQSLIISE